MEEGADHLETTDGQQARSNLRRQHICEAHDYRASPILYHRVASKRDWLFMRSSEKRRD